MFWKRHETLLMPAIEQQQGSPAAQASAEPALPDESSKLPDDGLPLPPAESEDIPKRQKRRVSA